MNEIKEIKDEELGCINGGTRPEEIGEPKSVYCYPSYTICPNCGGCMFLKTVRFNRNGPVEARYSPCSECGFTTQVITVFRTKV